VTAAPGDLASEDRRRGVRLGVDVGTVRIGVALCDPHGILATPLETVPRTSGSDVDIERLAALVVEHDVIEIVVGLPRTLRGQDGPAAAAARDFGDRLGRRVAPLPVVYTDERLTSVTANRVLAERGVSSRSRRPVVDQVAAVEILQSRLDALARGGAG
jgi:putative holliday junction resolvase